MENSKPWSEPRSEHCTRNDTSMGSKSNQIFHNVNNGFTLLHAVEKHAILNEMRLGSRR